MKNKEEILKSAFEDVIWMAIRYADGRNTYAPEMVRQAIYKFKQVYPDWEPKHDITIEKPDPHISGLRNQYNNYLYDLFKNIDI